MRARLTYVPIEVAEQFSDFIIEKDEEIEKKYRDYLEALKNR